MCGIVGGCAQRDIVPILIEGLRRLEYRGYDSAGVAVILPEGRLIRHRTAGRVADLEARLATCALPGGTGIAHTRWATHGEPNEVNAHPHVAGEAVAVVHNGIIENHEALRRQLESAGHAFTSETDSEVVATLIEDRHCAGASLFDAVRDAARELEGAYAIGVVSAREPGRIVVARRGSPLVVGLGIGEHFIASDVAALLPVTRRFLFLEDGDVAEVRREGVTVCNASGQTVERPVRTSGLSPEAVDRGGYRHFMLKEIHEQPRAVRETLEGRHDQGRVVERALGPGAAELLGEARRLQIIACGTSYHAGLVARYWCERYAGIPCDVEVASEYRYRTKAVVPGTVLVTISQSGETADTLAALRQARTLGYAGALTICNVPESSLVRESDLALMTRAGPEIGVASTKAFTTQLAALLLVIGVLARTRGRDADERALVEAVSALPGALERVLGMEEAVAGWAEQFVDRRHTLFLGRGAHYPVALEGALKLKEISYIHAEAYPAGELKHGPLALVDDDMPVVAVAPRDGLMDKLQSNLQEVRARGGRLYVFADDAAALRTEGACQVLSVPGANLEAISPVVHTVPLQLLAYHVAVLRGTDVDKPRNLAKSVTVE